MNVIKIAHQATFHQMVRLSEIKPIKGVLVFMTCDGSRCLPPAEVDFSFDIPLSDQAKNEKDQENKKDENQGSDNESGGLMWENNDNNQSTDSSQILTPVKWQISFQGDQLVLDAEIEDGWQIYSQSMSPDVGPIPAEILINDNKVVFVETAEQVLEEQDPVFKQCDGHQGETLCQIHYRDSTALQH